MTRSTREIALIRKASVLAGLGLLEAMKSTRPGIREYEAAAAAPTPGWGTTRATSMCSQPGTWC